VLDCGKGISRSRLQQTRRRDILGMRLRAGMGINAGQATTARSAKNGEAGYSS